MTRAVDEGGEKVCVEVFFMRGFYFFIFFLMSASATNPPPSHAHQLPVPSFRFRKTSLSLSCTHLGALRDRRDPREGALGGQGRAPRVLDGQAGRREGTTDDAAGMEL